ncbi:MAG: MFS transporter [Anaerolineae bacterium]
MFRSKVQSQSSTGPARSSAAQDKLSVLSIVRLTLPKLGVAFSFAMLLSVYNRVMIEELGILPIVVGVMYLLYNLINGFGQVTVGRVSDRRPIFGLRRTPYLLAGLLISSLALTGLPFVSVAASADPSLIFGLFVVMIVFGVGFALAGDSHNALIAELTVDKKNRSTVIAVVWFFQIFASIVVAIAVSIALQIADRAAGAPPACMTEACHLIRKEVALQMMPTIFALGPLVGLIGWLPLIGLEPRLTRAQAQAAASRPSLHLVQAYTRILSNPQARVFFFFVFISIFALFVQDDILEPFGARVFKLPVSATAQFQPIMGAATMLAMLVMGIIAGARAISKRKITNAGAAIAGFGLLMLGLSAVFHVMPVMYAGIAALGLGMGVFNIGALSMMMDMTVPGETGSLMGAWGMAQAIATGLANFLGTFLLQLGLALTSDNAELTYALIFGLSALLCAVAIYLVQHVNVEKFQKMTREQISLTLEAA